MTHAPTAPSKHDNDAEEADSTPPPPDGGWGWVVVFASFMIHIVTDGVTYSFGILYVEFLNYFQEGKGATAWIASILVGVTLCSGPISSSFVNRYGCRAVTIAGSVLGAICLILSMFAENVITLYFTIGIGTGFGFGLIYLPAIVSVTCYFEKYRSLATGIAVCGSGLGTFLFAPITEAMINEFGWRGTLLLISGLVFNCSIFGALFRPLEYENDKKRVKVKEDGGNNKYDAKISLLGITKNPSAHDLTYAIQRPVSMGNFTMPRQNKVVELYQSKECDTLEVGEASRLALSQPALVTLAASAVHSEQQRNFFASQNLRHPSSGIMYRPDVFYRGSLHNIPQHRSLQIRSSLKLPHEKQLELEREHNRKSASIVEEDTELDDDGMTTACGCIPCSQETKDTLTEMLDFSLFKDVIFILFTVSNFCTSIGFNIPYVYVVAQAEERNVPKEYSSYLLSIIGIANTVGRVILGYISDKPWINRLLVYNLCLTICGISTVLSAFCYDFLTFAIYCSAFGFTIGAYVGLTSVILVDLLGLDRLTNAFGLLLLFQGIASLLGPPIAGWLYDGLGSYDPGFIVSGVTIAASGLMLFFIPSLQRYLDRKKQTNVVTACKNGIVQKNNV